MQDTKTLKRHDLPMQYAPVLTVTPGSVDPIELALYEAVLHEKRVLVLYPLMNDVPSLSDLDDYTFSSEISMVTRSYGNQAITTKNGGKIRFLATNLKGGSPWNADLAIVVQTTAATPTSLGLV